MSLKKIILVTGILLVLFSLLCGCTGNAPGGIMVVSVIDSGGNPLWGAKVVSEIQPAGQLKIDGITSQEAGGAVFNGIEAGNYRIQVSRYGFAPETRDVTVKTGEAQVVVIILYYASPPIT
jgi:hypothetical protein